jgi:DNA-binding NtrC family response regulator
MNKHLGYKEFEISALNSLRISDNINTIDMLDRVIFNLIKVSEGQKISSEDVESYLQGYYGKEENRNNIQEDSVINEAIFNKPLKESREEFEKLYFDFHMQKKISVSELAKMSGVERTHLYRKLKSLGIKSK